MDKYKVTWTNSHGDEITIIDFPTFEEANKFVHKLEFNESEFPIISKME